MYQKILVPIDGSDTARLGLREDIKLAKSSGARIRLICTVDELPAVSPPAEAASDAVLAQLRSAGESILQEGATAVRDAGVQVDSKLVEAMGGEAGAHIVQESQAWHPDLIVCGTHGRRGIRRAVMGSAAEYVLRRSAIPVLLVPSGMRAAA